MSIQILSPGPLTTVQDQGRIGYMHSGFPQSGAMDFYAASLANILCGNGEDAAVLEMTVGGVTCRFTEEIRFAICGAKVHPTLDGADVAMQQCIVAPAGSVLKIGAAVAGCRIYMAVAGGFDVPLVMGSRSTNLRCAVGGYAGRKLQAGDELAVLPADTDTAGAHLPYEAPAAEITVRSIPGPQNDYFTKTGLRTFFTEAYTVSAASDRMGMKLSGTPLASVAGTDIVSDGIAPGSVQVPAGGQPIILLADRQTVGGYAKIATVIRADLPRLAQLRPGDTVRFEKTNRKKALAALQKLQRSLADAKTCVTGGSK